MKELGKWHWDKGSIIVTVPKWRTTIAKKKVTYKCKYVGDAEEPFKISAVEQDMLSEHNTHCKLIKTSSRGGKVMELD